MSSIQKIINNCSIGKSVWCVDNNYKYVVKSTRFVRAYTG